MLKPDVSLQLIQGVSCHAPDVSLLLTKSFSCHVNLVNHCC